MLPGAGVPMMLPGVGAGVPMMLARAGVSVMPSFAQQQNGPGRHVDAWPRSGLHLAGGQPWQVDLA